MSNIYAQCEDYSQSQCSNDVNCDWIVDIDYGSCNNLGSSACDANPNCWGAYTNPGWYYGWYCAGGSYQIDNSYCEEIEMPECSEMNEMECSSYNSCEWIENIEIEFCGGYNQGECLEQQGCWWYPGGPYLGEYCSGSYEVDNSYCVESEDSQCQDYQFQCSDGTCICLNSGCLNNADSVICDGVFDCIDGSDEIDCSECSWINESACSNDANCNWIENIEAGNCNWLSTSECVDNPQCWLDCVTNYDCFGCTGGWYEIDNGFCEEVEVLECFEMNEMECTNDDGCEWVEDFEIGQCSQFDNSEISCTSYPGECYWDEDITYSSCNGYDNNQWACNNAQGCYWDCSNYYSWDCGCYGQEQIINTECIGQYEINNNYCDELSYIPGDTNGDGSLNVSDIVLIVDLILSSEYYEYSDMNQDGILNIMDIIELVNRILDR